MVKKLFEFGDEGHIGSEPRLIYDRFVYDGDGNKKDRSKYIKQKSVGSIMRFSYGAPGVGYCDYKITKIDRDGIWGIEIGGFCGELEASDVA